MRKAILFLGSLCLTMPLFSNEEVEIDQQQSPQVEEEITYQNTYSSDEDMNERQGRLQTNTVSAKRQRDKSKCEQMRSQGRLHHCEGGACKAGSPQEGRQKYNENESDPENTGTTQKSGAAQPYQE